MIDARHMFINAGGRRDFNGNPIKIASANILGIAAHHSVGPTLSPTASIEQEIASLKAIEAQHIGQGYGLFGYHAAAFPSGRCYQVGDWNGQRAHVAKRNHEIVGVVAMGTFTTEAPSSRQMAAMAEAMRAIRTAYQLTLPVQGHGKWALPGEGTACAGAYMNGLTTGQWDSIIAVGQDTNEEDPQMHLYAGLAHAAFFENLALNGNLDVWTSKSSVPGDLNIPSDARSVEAVIYLKEGALEVAHHAGGGAKAGLCLPGVSHWRVYLGDDVHRSFGIRSVNGPAVIDKIEVLGWYAS